MNSASYEEVTASGTASQKVDEKFVEVTLDTSTKKPADDPETPNLARKLAFILFSTVTFVIIVVVVYLTVLKKDDSNETPAPSSKTLDPPDDMDVDLGNGIHKFTRDRWEGQPIQDGYQNRTEPKDDEMPYTPKPENSSGLEETDYDLGNDIHIFTRHRWSGHAILDGYQNRTLVHPIKLVIIGHTVSPQCMTFETCASRLQFIQSQHVGEWDYVDIGYNFLVGGDGNIYQALGWDIRNYLRNNSIQIQFIGNYIFDKVLDRQRLGLQALLKLGVKLGKLDKDYLLVAHSQVASTLSPGTHLLAEIKLWPHYYNETVI